jgi:hypothetical protein
MMVNVRLLRFDVLISYTILTCVTVWAGGCGTSPESMSSSNRIEPQVTPVSESASSGSNVITTTEQANAAPIAEAEDDSAGADHIAVEKPTITPPVAADQTAAVGEGTPVTPQPPSPPPTKDAATKIEATPEQIAQWKRPTYEPLHLLACRESASSAFVAKMGCTADGHHIIQAGLQVTLWSLDAEEPEYVFLESAGKRQFTALAVAPDGNWFAAGDSEGTLRIWNISDRAEVVSKTLNSSAIADIAISPDSAELAVISYDNEVSTWTSDKLREKNRFKVDTNNLNRIVYVTPDLLAAAGETTTIWSVDTGAIKQTISEGRYNYSLARSPDHTRLAYGENDVLQFWDISQAKRTGEFTGGVTTNELVAFSADGHHLATANGSSVRIWDIAANQLLQVIDTFGSPIVGLNWLPVTNLLVVASENSRTRIWGTSTAAQAVHMAPLHSAVDMPDPAAQLSATPAQLEQMLDLRTFPRIPGGSVRTIDTFSLSDSVPVNLEEAMLFYRYQLTAAGWIESVDPAQPPGSLQFLKDGFRISTSFYEEGPAKTSANISFLGNYNLLRVPKFDAAPIETVFETPDVVIYRTEANLLQIETTLLRRLHAAGWTAYARLHASHTENQDNRNLEFLRDGLILRVSIGRFPSDPERFNVQYSQAPTSRSIPVPPDSGFVEFDGSTQPYLVATTSMSLQEATEFYDKQMTDQDWLIRDFGRSINKEQHQMSYVRCQREVTVVLQTTPAGRTLVRLGDELENASWQLVALKPDATTDEPAAVGLEAADFPLLNDSKSAKFDALAKAVDISMDATPLPDVAEQYTEALQTLGWKWDGAGIKSDDYVFLTFTMGKAEIALRARKSDGQSTVNIQGDGLVWNKPLPGGKKIISYEAWLRSNRQPATLDLIDTYMKEMRSIGGTVAPE